MVVGSQSYIAYAYNQGNVPEYPNNLVYEHVPIIEDSLQETVSPAVSSFMPRDRTGHKVLQGFRTVDGTITTELDMVSFAEWLGVLAGNTVSFAEVSVPTFPGFGLFGEGEYYKGSNNVTYLCVRGGKINSPQSLNHTCGDKTLEETVWRYVGEDIDRYEQTAVSISNDPLEIPFTLIKSLIDTDCGNPLVNRMQFPDCSINSVDMNMDSQGNSRMIWEILGKKANDVTNNDAAIREIYPKGSTGLPLHYETYLYFNKEKRFNVTSFQLGISNNIESEAFTLGSRYRKELPKKDAVVEGSLNMYVEDAVDIQTMRLEKDFELLISLNWEVFHSSIMLPRCKYMDGDILPELSNRVSSVGMNFRAFTKDVFETPIVITIKKPKFD